MTPSTAWCDLGRSFKRLSECHAKLRSEFATLGDVTLGRFLGPELNCPQMRERIRNDGDGYTMHLRVDHAARLKDYEAVVLFAMTSPKLDRDSVFDGTALHEIPYWRDKKRLCTVVQVANKEYRLLFLSWQQNCPIHGKDDAHATRNKKLLSNNDRIRRLLEEEPKLAREYLATLGDWYHAHRLPLLLIRHHQRSLCKLHEALLDLVRSNRAECVPSNLRGRNYKIMNCFIPAHLRKFGRKTPRQPINQNSLKSPSFAPSGR